MTPAQARKATERGKERVRKENDKIHIKERAAAKRKLKILADQAKKVWPKVAKVIKKACNMGLTRAVEPFYTEDDAKAFAAAALARRFSAGILSHYHPDYARTWTVNISW